MDRATACGVIECDRLAIFLRVLEFAIHRRYAALQCSFQLRQRTDENDQPRTCSSRREEALTGFRVFRWSLLTSAATEFPSLRQGALPFQFRRHVAAGA